jgi:NAD(P)-dependent dehydrogenase (short-subunit alcohol dehydrogenase family)
MTPDINERFSVDGQTAIITGSSQGIGRAIAEQFAQEGANLTVSSRDQDKIDEVADGINDSDAPGRAIAIECDVTERDAVENLIESTVDEFGSLDVLVNNAGAGFMSDFEDISPNGWKTIVDINLHGTYHCTQVAGDYLEADGGGTVINFASVAGTDGSAKMSPYGAAKAAVVNFTTSIGVDWADRGIRMNCIAPGLVATPGVASQMGIEADEIDRTEVDRQIGHVDEIADLAQFLASDASSYMIGETVEVKGKPRLGESSN